MQDIELNAVLKIKRNSYKSIEQQIIDTAARYLADAFESKAFEVFETDLRKGMKNAINKVIDEAMDQPIQLTDSYGSPKGAPINLNTFAREQLQQEVKKNSYLLETMRKMLDDAVQKELKPKLDEITKEFTKGIHEEMAEKIKKAVLNSVALITTCK